MNPDINNIIKDLKKQPIFQLSLADKELVHSNVLAWLTTDYPAFFLSVLEGMTTTEGDKVNTTNWRDEFLQGKLKVKREYNNFDLCILRGLDPFFILENKNKSIPYLNQLVVYNKKSKSHNPERLLLSLATDIPDRKNITDAGWKIVSYKDLAAAMKVDQLPPDIDSYRKSIIGDYQQFVSNLADLSNQLLSVDSYFIDDKVLKELADCRMDDLAQKIRYSSFAAQLSTDYLGREIVIADAKEIKKSEYKPGTVYASQDYTSRGGATGIIQLAVKLHQDFDYSLKIQVQGEHYRHALEWLDIPSSCTKERMTQLLNSPRTQPFFEEVAFGQKELFEDSFYPVTKEIDEIESVKTDEKKNSIQGYNHFGLGFQYRSKKLLKNPDLTYRDLLSHMVEDLSRFL